MFLLFLLVPAFSFSQGLKVVLLSNNGNPSYFAGSLPKSNSGVYEKLKIVVFGGNWHNSNLGENTYYISSRDGLKINQEVHGGSYSKYALKVYENGDKYDIIIQVTGDWPSIAIRSWKMSGLGATAFTETNITEYDPAGKVDISSQVPVNTLFAITNAGKVGIGTITPDSDALMTVAGNIKAREIKVTATAGGADFVFAEDYSLPSLEEVAGFVQKNRHLPEIPSAAEMEANGLHLAEMNIKLLQKVEELTLYAIEQEKKLQARDELIQQMLLRLEALEKAAK